VQFGFKNLKGPGHLADIVAAGKRQYKGQAYLYNAEGT